MKRDFLVVLLLLVLLLIGGGEATGPFPADRFTVLIVEETDPRSPLVAAAINSEDWQEYVKSRGGWWRALDQDIEAASLSEPWRSAMLAAQGKPVPRVYVSGDGAAYEGPLPTREGELLKLLKGL